jgi:hypothetical protein
MQAEAIAAAMVAYRAVVLRVCLWEEATGRQGVPLLANSSSPVERKIEHTRTHTSRTGARRVLASREAPGRRPLLPAHQQRGGALARGIGPALALNEIRGPSSALGAPAR